MLVTEAYPSPFAIMINSFATLLKATAATEIPWTGRTSKAARRVHIHLRNTSGILMAKVQDPGTPRGHKPAVR